MNNNELLNGCFEEEGDLICFKDGLYHCEDGPDLINANGDKEWWINNKQLTEEEFNEYIQIKNMKKNIRRNLSVNKTESKPLKI